LIKINLLSVDRDRAKKKAKFQIGQKITVGCSLILVATALIVGWWYWSLQSDSAALNQQILDAQRETARLQSVIQQVRQYEEQRAQLQQRVTLIEQLRRGQTGPVHLIDQISRSLPDTMWLVEVKEAASGDVVIDGRCTSLTALSDFVSSLEASSYFAKPVEIVDSTVDPATATAPEVIRFSVKGKFVSPAN
jgi:type IV pilus assembly protein PilN